MKNYDNFLFDLYGTLIDIRTNEDDEKLWNTIRILYGYEGAEYSNTELKEMYHKFVQEEKADVKEEPEQRNEERRRSSRRSIHNVIVFKSLKWRWNYIYYLLWILFFLYYFK